MVKFLVLKENRGVLKQMFEILLPTEKWDIKLAVDEIARRIPQIKSEMGLGF
jgi:hypothetical protein